jgi:hypothetical protein
MKKPAQKVELLSLAVLKCDQPASRHRRQAQVLLVRAMHPYPLLILGVGLSKCLSLFKKGISMNLRKKLVSFATWIGLKDKSGWDIITDLSLPLAIFIGGSAFTYVMNPQSQANSEEALKDSILSGYLESMRQIFATSDDPRLKDPASLRKVIAARALTLTALDRLSSERDETDKVGSNKRKGVVPVQSSGCANGQMQARSPY